MTEGLDVNLALSGATLLSVFGLAAKVWLQSRPQKIQQPLEVRAADDGTPRAQCEERHDEILKWRDNMYARVIKLETDAAAYQAELNAMRTQLGSMDGKLDILIKRR